MVKLVVGYSAHVARFHRLPDGRQVLIRPIRPTDEAAARRFFDALSDKTRHLRFMRGVGTVDDELIRFFTHIDYEQHMAFVCEASAGSQSELVGDARYLVEGTAGEFSVVIADGWHKSGIANLLMDALMEHACAHGLHTIEGLVLRENRHMLNFVKALGFEVSPTPEDSRLARVIRKLA